MYYRDSDYEFYRDFPIDDGRCGWELLIMNAGEKVNAAPELITYAEVTLETPEETAEEVVEETTEETEEEKVGE